MNIIRLLLMPKILIYHQEEYLIANQRKILFQQIVVNQQEEFIQNKPENKIKSQVINTTRNFSQLASSITEKRELLRNKESCKSPSFVSSVEPSEYNLQKVQRAESISAKPRSFILNEQINSKSTNYLDDLIKSEAKKLSRDKCK